jgi:TonB family protein
MPSRPARPAPLPFTWGGNAFALPPPPNPPAPERTARSHGALDLSVGPQALNSVGAPPRSTHGLDAEIRVEGADVGDDWIQRLHEWWDRHSFYPEEAVMNGEDGVVEIHMVIQRDGRVESVQVVSSSGSRWLDMAGVSVFRNAHLRPFPLSTPQPQADVYVSLHYILVRVPG